MEYTIYGLFILKKKKIVQVYRIRQTRSTFLFVRFLPTTDSALFITMCSGPYTNEDSSPTVLILHLRVKTSILFVCFRMYTYLYFFVRIYVRLTIFSILSSVFSRRCCYKYWHHFFNWVTNFPKTSHISLDHVSYVVRLKKMCGICVRYFCGRLLRIVKTMLVFKVLYLKVLCNFQSKI